MPLYRVYMAAYNDRSGSLALAMLRAAAKRAPELALFVLNTLIGIGMIIGTQLLTRFARHIPPFWRPVCADVSSAAKRRSRCGVFRGWPVLQ